MSYRQLQLLHFLQQLLFSDISLSLNIFLICFVTTDLSILPPHLSPSPSLVIATALRQSSHPPPSLKTCHCEQGADVAFLLKKATSAPNEAI